MAVNEQIVTGRKFRKLVDEVTKLWQRISFWTKASDVEFDDGENAEIKVGAINGVTDSLTSTSSNIAASAKAVKELNDKVTQLSSDLMTREPVVILDRTFNLPQSSGCHIHNTDYTIPKAGRYTFAYICSGNVYYGNKLIINGVEVGKNNPDYKQNTYTANMDEGDTVTYQTAVGYSADSSASGNVCVGCLVIY